MRKIIVFILIVISTYCVDDLRTITSYSSYNSILIMNSDDCNFSLFDSTEFDGRSVLRIWIPGFNAYTGFKCVVSNGYTSVKMNLKKAYNEDGVGYMQFFLPGHDVDTLLRESKPGDKIIISIYDFNEVIYTRNVIVTEDYYMELKGYTQAVDRIKRRW